jgi:hypothetical protein
MIRLPHGLSEILFLTANSIILRAPSKRVARVFTTASTQKTCSQTSSPTCENGASSRHSVRSWLICPSLSREDASGYQSEPHVSQSKRDRESYFARFAPEMRRNIKRAKLMVTGGFRTTQGMADAITTDGVDLIGLSRPLCLAPDAPAALLRGTLSGLTARENELRIGPGLAASLP